MTPQVLIADLQDKGVIFSVKGDTLKIEAKRGSISPEKIEKLRSHKAEIIRILQEPQKEPTIARGYGCAGCGNKIFEALQAWESSELPASSPWMYEHIPVIYWKCLGCGAVFQWIGRTKDPELTN